MLVEHLNQAGFFPIQWAAAEPGTTYVRPGAQGVLRVFVPAAGTEIELYTGRLTAGELRYRGPVPPAAELRQWLRGYFGRLLPLRGATVPAAALAAAA